MIRREDMIVDGEGMVFDIAGATCPGCQKKTTRADYHFTPWTSWHCGACGLSYDEPDFDSDFFLCDEDDIEEFLAVEIAAEARKGTDNATG